MRTVLYSCAFVPGEWIAAHGFHASRAIPSSCHDGSREGLCPYVQSFVHLAATTQPAAVIVSTVCDQMRRAEELLAAETNAPVYVLHVPAAQRSVGAKEYYRSELERLGVFLQNLGGTSPSPADLLSVMKQYDAQREEERCEIPLREGVKRLALVGGELLREDRVIFDWIAQADGCVVLDATDQGHRSLPARIQFDRAMDDPLGALADAYFDAIPHAFRRPDDGLFAYLARELPRCGVQGIVFRHYPWCDTWNAVLPRLREEFPLPVLNLDSVCDGGDTNRQTGRLEAFMEALS